MASHIERRKFLASLGAAAAWPLVAAGRQAGPAHVIGVLAQDLQPGLLETVRDELHNLGYVEGRNISIEVRNAAGRSEQLPALANDLLRFKVEIILAINTSAAKAAKNATNSVPIVIMRVADPVKSGLVASLARPGGNVTGLSFMPDELGAKSIEILREALPGISRVGVLYQGDNPGAVIVANAVESRGTQLGLQVLRLPVVHPKDYAGAFETAARARVEALFATDDGAITKQRGQILELAAKYSLPVGAVYKDFARAGAIVAYGPRVSVMYRRAAYYVDKILKGAAPRDLPIEQPDKFDLFVNLKTAKALGLQIPDRLLAIANEVIE
jgi:putative tryptophan/tyrosine transport system substrate-binding protein